MANIHTLTRRLAHCLSEKFDRLQHRVALIAVSLRDTLADVLGTSLADTLATLIREMFEAFAAPQSEPRGYSRYGAQDYWGEPISDWDQPGDSSLQRLDPEEIERRTTWRRMLSAAWEGVAWLWRNIRTSKWRWGTVCAGAALGSMAAVHSPAWIERLGKSVQPLTANHD